MAKIRTLGDSTSDAVSKFQKAFYGGFTNLNDLAYLHSVAPAIYFAEHLVHDLHNTMYVVKNSGKIAKDIAEMYMKGDSELAKQVTAKYLSLGLAAALNLIPGVGTLLSGLVAGLNIFLGFNPFAIETRNRSAVAANRLNEFNGFYFKSKNVYNYPDDVRNFISSKIDKLIAERPKCVAFTNNCAEEHAIYIARTDLLYKALTMLGQINLQIVSGNSIAAINQYYIVGINKADEFANEQGGDGLIAALIAGAALSFIIS